MKNPMAVAVTLAVLFAVATLAVIVWGALSATAVRCEVCIEYQGRKECREALGATREEATRTATDNACAFLASGMTQSVECTTRTRPFVETCDGD